jgi:hypothetical protein
MLVTAACNQSKSVDCVKDATLVTTDVTAVVMLSAFSGSRLRAVIAIGSLCSPVRITMEDLRSERRGCPKEGQQHCPLSVSKNE